MTDDYDDALALQLQWEQARDRERAEQDLRDVIEHAQRLGLPGDEVKYLKWYCGIPNR